MNVEGFKRLAKLTSNGHMQLIPVEFAKEALLIRVTASNRNVAGEARLFEKDSALPQFHE